MYRFLLLLATATAFTTLALAIDDTETIRQSLPVSARLEVKNLNGSIHVTGTTSNGIEVIATKRIHADDQNALTQARNEIKLDVQSSGDGARVCVTNVWDDCHGQPDYNYRGSRCRNRDCDRDYWVTTDLEIRVPTRTVLDVHTVNGSVTVEKTQGNFDAKTVNGSVTVEDVDGAGSAHTVNGSVKLSFAGSPREPIFAKTVNGGIEAAFPKSLNANMSFKTFSGDVFTSFPSTAMTNDPPNVERRNGRTIIRGGTGYPGYRSNRNFSVKVGAGGPEHRFETLHGNIEIAER